jgi:hypothetical protein
MNKIKLILICLLVILESCCKDLDPSKDGCQCEKPNVVNGPYYLGITKDYLYFKPGSWWVYKNNLSNETDSIVNLLCDTSLKTIKEEYPKAIYSSTFTTLLIKQKSFLNNYTTTYLCDKVSPDDYHFLLDKTTFFTNKTRYSTPYIFPFQVGFGYIETIPSKEINGKTFNDVLVFQVWSDESVQLPTLPYNFRPSAPTKYYWAKGVGLVMIEQTLYKVDTQSTIVHKWEITNFNLI